MDLLEETYDRIKEDPDIGLQLEPHGIIKAVDDHRRFWKPEKVRIILLAESHVFTDKEKDYQELDYSKLDHNKIAEIADLKYCPKSMVRFVYCLGYGENELIKDKLAKNRGTPQFWKIFVACTSEDNNFKFGEIKKTETKDLQKRIENKIKILEKLRKKGIWLLDASIVALYNGKGKPTPKTMKNIIKRCWNEYISKVIIEEEPECIIIIGEGVGVRLKDYITKNTPKEGYIKVNDLKIPCEIIPQPQGIRTKEKIKSTFEEYQKLCNQ